MAVRVAGLTETIRALKAATNLDALGSAFGQAAELVAVTAAAKAAATGRRADAVLAATYKASRSQRSGVLNLGGGNAWLGNEFGSAHDKLRQRKSGTYLGYNQFPLAVPGGRFVYPATVEKTEAITELLADALMKAMLA